MIHRFLKRAVGVFQKEDNSTVIQNNAASIARIGAEGERIAFISSYPRSGNTWFRSLLSDCFIQNMGLSTSTKLPVQISRIVPDRYCDLIDERDASIVTPGLFVKTHDPFETALGLLPPTAYENMRHVYLYRRPEDALVSYYHYHRRYPEMISQTEDGIDAFCLQRLDEWYRHVESYVEASNTYDDCIFLVSYETMLSKPETMLMSVLSWLNVPIESETIQRAVSNMSFGNLRANEEKNPKHKEEFFYRKGTSGGGQQELQTSTLDAIITESSGLLRTAESILAA